MGAHSSPHRASSSVARASVRDWPADQRPRERLRTLGPKSLSSTELLTILIGSGGRSGSATQLADRVLAWGGGRLRGLASASPTQLEGVAGIGEATSARLLAALELGRRLDREALPERPPIRGPSDVFDLLSPHLRDLAYEEFHALLLNTQHRVLRDVIVTKGILDASLIHPREVFRPAIVEGAAAVILVHNHPSGDPTPSSQDLAVSRQMIEAGRTIGIPVLDHVIVADRGWATAT